MLTSFFTKRNVYIQLILCNKFDCEMKICGFPMQAVVLLSSDSASLANLNFARSACDIFSELRCNF